MSYINKAYHLLKHLREKKYEQFMNFKMVFHVIDNIWVWSPVTTYRKCLFWYENSTKYQYLVKKPNNKALKWNPVNWIPLFKIIIIKVY